VSDRGFSVATGATPFAMRPSRLRIALQTFVAAITLSLVAPAAAQTALPTIAPQGRTPYVAVLVWHDVLPAKEVWFDTTTATFEQQLQSIEKGGFHVIRLSALRDHLVTGSAIPAKSLVLTFDDNGAGIYQYAFPLFRKYRFPATLFVHTNYVGKTTSKHHNTWDQLREMEVSGLVEVQSLTANHPPDLTKLNDADVTHELRLSAFSLEHRLGHKIYALVYPYDVYDSRVERLAAQNGYTLAFTEDWGNAADSSSLLEVHRYSILTRFDQALADVAAHSR
jgi:poly-beta-1,6-N-acetyl-D-glucosamine N-deacetylase